MLASLNFHDPFYGTLAVCIIVLVVCVIIRYIVDPLTPVAVKVLNVLMILAALGIVISFAIWLIERFTS